MPIIAHKQIKKTGLSEAYLEIKQRIDELEEENLKLLGIREDLGTLVKVQDKEIKKLQLALKKCEKEKENYMKHFNERESESTSLILELEKEIEKLKNPRIWKNDGEL